MVETLCAEPDRCGVRSRSVCSRWADRPGRHRPPAYAGMYITAAACDRSTMADERSPGEPEPGDDPTPGSGSDGYQLGGGGKGSSGSGSSGSGSSGSGSGGQGSGGFGTGAGAGGQPGNPFEAFMNQFGGGDMNQLMSQLQDAVST